MQDRNRLIEASPEQQRRGSPDGSRRARGPGSSSHPLGAAPGVVNSLAVARSLAEAVNPSAEDQYWRRTYRSRPYTEAEAAYDLYRPAYRFGWESRIRYFDRHWDEVEAHLARDWGTRHESDLAWSRAREAARDAWDRLDGNDWMRAGDAS